MEEQKQDSLKVAIRVRPLLSREMAKEQAVFVEVESTQGTTIRVTDDAHLIESHYDKVFAPSCSNQDVFEYISPSLIGVTQGFNATVFAYGQTGSGKTHTMFGSEWESNLYSRRSLAHTLDDPSTHGVIPKSVMEMFQRVSTDAENKQTVLCSFLQIYNERIFDLLQDSNLARPLNIREDTSTGIFVEGLAEYVVQNMRDVMALIKRGDRNRCVRKTRMNAASSRSHTIFQIQIESDRANQKGMMQKAKLNLCDLAGSEKFDKSGQVSDVNQASRIGSQQRGGPGMRRRHMEEASDGSGKMSSNHLAEMNNINLSLTTLGKVVAHLSKRSRGHVPYRDSKLTRLLQDSLGGNTQTVFIVTVSPLTECVEETLSTLKFADRAKQVMVKVKRNEFSATSGPVVIKLQREVLHLKEMLQLRKQGPMGLKELNQKLWLLKEENSKLREMTHEFSPQEVEKLKEENKQMRIQLQRMFDSTMTTSAAMSVDTPRATSQASQLSFMSKHSIEGNLSLCAKCGSAMPCQDHPELNHDHQVSRQMTGNSSISRHYSDHISDTSSSKPLDSRLSTFQRVGNMMMTKQTEPVEVRIRTRNALVEKKMGSVGLSWEEEERSKRREIDRRRAIERLQTLERLEQHRALKAREQIAKLEEARQLEEQTFVKKDLAEARRMRQQVEQRRKADLSAKW